MGQSSSKLIDEDSLDEYVQLTYLKRAQILHILHCFHAMCPVEAKHDIGCFLPVELLEEHLPELKVNPFQDRLYDVFFLKRDANGYIYFSFEEMLDLCSALSPNCPDRVKAMWAFKVFDFDGDGLIGENDIVNIVERLIMGNSLDEEEKRKIAETVLKEINISKTGAVTPMEFVHAIIRMPDFSNCFRLEI